MNTSPLYTLEDRHADQEDSDMHQADIEGFELVGIPT